MKILIHFLIIIICIIWVTGCSQSTPATVQKPIPSTVQESIYSTSDGGPKDDVKDDVSALVSSNNIFSFEMYQKLKNSQSDNFFYSPYSIYTALAMTYAGARRTTALQMADALHFRLPEDQVHSALKVLADRLNYEGKSNTKNAKMFEMNIANALWGAKGYSFQDNFIQLVNTAYGAELKSLDFSNGQIASREIN
jgi:serpin B